MIAPRIRTVAVAGVTGALLVLAACGDPEPAASPTQPTAVTSPAATSKPSEVDLSPIEVGKTINYEGFSIVVKRGTFSGEPRISQKLSFALEVKNPGVEARNFNLSAGLRDDRTEVATGFVDGSVKVLPDAKADAVLEFRTSGKEIKPADLSLVFGKDTEQQAIVPLVGEQGFTPLFPTKQAVPAPVAVGPITLTPTSAEVNFANVRSTTASMAPKGKAFVIVNFDVTATESYNISGKDVAVTGPAGKFAGVDDFGRDYNAPSSGPSKAKLVLQVDEDFAGDYTVTITATRPAGATGTMTLSLKP